MTAFSAHEAVRPAPASMRRGAPGVFTISLDFELWWGIREGKRLEDERARLLEGRRAVRGILDLFRRYEIHATWATVGLLFCDGRREAQVRAPARRPAYARGELSPYDEVDALGAREEEDPCRLAPSLVREILATPHQEVGTHTFSHFYCGEDGVGTDEFLEDLHAAQAAADPFGVRLQSLVFPRNQCDPRFVEAAGRGGVLAYRGNPDQTFYDVDPARARAPARRALRLADAYLPVSGFKVQRVERPRPGQPVNVPASRFLRPASSKLAFAEPVRLLRILAEMTQAARRGGLYHLWFHEHNFGESLAKNLGFLEQILIYSTRLRERYGMLSLSMGEVARAALESEPC